MKKGHNQFGEYMSEEDIQFIKDNYNSMNNSEIGKVINKKSGTINCKLRKLGLKRNWYHYYTQEEIDFIKNNMNNMNNKELGLIIKTSAMSIKHLIMNKNLKRDFCMSGKSNNYLKKEDIEFIKKNYQTMSYSEIAKMLHKHRDTINIKAINLGLKREDKIGTETIINQSLEALKFKKDIMIRDNFMCMICSSKNKLATHHINYNKQLNLYANVLTLCNSCHAKTNFCRKYWIKFFQLMLSEKYNYKYDSEENIMMEIKNEST
jgi:hypothetical protein